MRNTSVEIVERGALSSAYKHLIKLTFSDDVKALWFAMDLDGAEAIAQEMLDLVRDARLLESKPS